VSESKTYTDAGPVLDIQDLVQYFPGPGGTTVRAVDGVSLRVERGETVGLVGESGSGKTTVGRAALRLYKPTGGRVVFEGTDITGLKGRALSRVLRQRSAMVFQNPSTSLNPFLRTEDTLAEPLIVHRVGDGAERRRRVGAALDRVGLGNELGSRYPHELSGGQRQRVGIARALMLNPALIVADEPTASLDVSVQAQVVNLLQDIQAERDIGYLFISHDLALVRHLSHRIAVMYLGRIVEVGTAAEVFDAPLHPYAASLASMQLAPDMRIVPQGDLPSPSNPPPGCPFHPRCPIARDVCAVERPALVPADDVRTHRQVACHFPGELTLSEKPAHAAAPAAPLPPSMRKTLAAGLPPSSAFAATSS
jgi:oligopeptide/dipeptide ABC transporter ATP-binding protein